jgi:hypothetical protein
LNVARLAKELSDVSLSIAELDAGNAMPDDDCGVRIGDYAQSRECPAQDAGHESVTHTVRVAHGV